MVIPCQIEFAALTVQEMYLSLLHPALLSCETYSYIWENVAQNILYPSTCIFVFFVVGSHCFFLFHLWQNIEDSHVENLLETSATREKLW